MYYDWPVAESAQGKYYEYPPYHRHEHRHEEHRVRAVVVLCAQREEGWVCGAEETGRGGRSMRRQRAVPAHAARRDPARHGTTRHDTTNDTQCDNTQLPALPEAVRHPGEPHEHREHDREQQYHHVHGAHLIAFVLTCKRGVPRVSAPAPPAATPAPSNASTHTTICTIHTDPTIYRSYLDYETVLLYFGANKNNRAFFSRRFSGMRSLIILNFDSSARIRLANNYSTHYYVEGILH